MSEMFTLPFRPAYDSNGRFAPGAQAWFTLTETNTPTPVYADAALTDEQPNPLVADGLGKFPRSYLDPDIVYRCRVYVEDAVVGIDDPLTDHDYDPYTGSEQGSQGLPGPSAIILNPVVPVVTLAAGSPATASAVDQGGHVYQLNLGIPQGLTGASGALSNGDYGDIVVTLAGAAINIDAGAVTLAKMAPLAANSIIGNNTGAGATPVALSIAQVQALLGIAASRVYSVFIPATAMKPRATNPPGGSTTETATNKVNLETVDFDASATEYVQFAYAMPKSWDEGTVTAQFIWLAGGAGTVNWNIQGVSISDDDVLDTAFGAAVTVTDTVTAAGDLMQSAFTAAITLGGAPAEGDTVIFQAYRTAGSLASDAKLVGIRLNFTVNAQTDA
jgi:hypothetical protein